MRIDAAAVVTPTGVIQDGAVIVREGCIAWAGPAHAAPALPHARRLTGATLLPGFIDLHTHGFDGFAFDRGADAARQAARLLARTGVTGCYAALGAGGTLAEVAVAFAGAATVVGADTGGTRLLGLFLEGPFISPAKRGAWDAAGLRSPSLDDLRLLVEAGRGTVRRVNVAPELPGALDLIRAARTAGIAVALGHSAATYEQAVAAADAGATSVTHTFNAMSGLDHRAPGLAAAALTDDRLLCELILDGVHVHPAAARALWRARGCDGIALITDAAPVAGLADGDYRFLGQPVRVRGGACRLADGTLAGSVATFDAVARRGHELAGGDLVALAALTSGNAARAMACAGHTGTIQVGLDADLVLLDEQRAVLATMVRGQLVYVSDTIM